MASSGTSVGSMTKSIVIQSVANTTDAGGGRSVVWSTYKTVYANVQQLSGTTKYAQGVVDEKGAYVFTVRYTAGITTLNRINYNSQLFSITSVINPDERNKYLVIKADEGGAV